MPSATSSAIDPVEITSTGRTRVVAKPHDGAPAELPLDLGERSLQGLLPVAALRRARPVVRCHVKLPRGFRGLRRASLRQPCVGAVRFRVVTGHAARYPGLS